MPETAVLRHGGVVVMIIFKKMANLRFLLIRFIYNQQYKVCIARGY